MAHYPRLYRLTRALLGTVYVLCLAEVFVRVFAPAAVMPRFVQATPYGIRGNVPSMHYWHYTSDASVEFRINSAGMRDDHEYPLQKPPGRCRVALFGDSFFMGYEVNVEDSFAKLLEHQLQAAGYRCDVINFAVSGFGTAEELVALEKIGLQYSPDLVIFEWHRTDPDDNVRSQLYQLAQDGTLMRKNATYLPSLKLRGILDKVPLYRWAEQHSQLFSAIRERSAIMIKREIVRSRKNERNAEQAAIEAAGQEDIGAARDDAGNTVAGTNDTGAPKSGALRFPIALSRALLIQADSVARDHNADFMVFEIPNVRDRVTFTSVAPGLEPSIPGVSFASPLALFQAYARPDRLLYYEHGAGHWSPFGNQLAASYAVRYIETHHRQRLLPYHTR
jgi:hypothetical protein